MCADASAINGLLAWLTLLVITNNCIMLGMADQLGPVDCYRTNGYALGVEQVRCAASLPSSPTYCLKADVYDGRVVRDCASAAQCPQGDGCAPITYDEDGTTDFVCCCATDLCNSAREMTMHFFLFIFMPFFVSFLITNFGT